jgi:hypothetical protein
MAFTVSSTILVKGKKVKVSRTVESGDQRASIAAIEEVGEEARQLTKATQAAISSKPQRFRKK